jgi:hypothetical protein
MKRIIGIALALGLGGGGGAALAQQEIYLSDSIAQDVKVFDRAADGNVAALREIVGPSTGLVKPEGLVIDATHNEILVLDFNGGVNNGALVVHALAANGNATPIRKLTGPSTQFGLPVGLAFDPVHDEVFLMNSTDGKVLVFDRTASGDAAPKRTFTASFTTANGIYVDTVHDEVVIAYPGANAIEFFARTATGTPAPLRTILGASTGLANPNMAVIDAVNDEVFASNTGGSSITVYSRTATGNASPLRTISGVSTQLDTPRGMYLDLPHDELVVAGHNSVATFSRTASGNAAPVRNVAGSAPLIGEGDFPFIGPAATSTGTSFYALTPCRLVDTRNPPDPFGGPAIAALSDRSFTAIGRCGISPLAKAVVLNVAVTLPTNGGDLRLYPAGAALPLVSAINYAAGQTRANNAVIPLNASGDFAVHSDQPAGTVHLILDVSGYFQ